MRRILAWPGLLAFLPVAALAQAVPNIPEANRSSLAPPVTTKDILAAEREAANIFSVKSYGAKGDGAANDAPAFMAAFAACYAAGGGTVRVPSTGHAYHLATGLVLDGGACGLVGDGVPSWPGPVGTEAQWTTVGSWVSCDDTVHPCLLFNSSGYVDGIDFWHPQPTPSATSGTPWTPTGVAPAGTDPSLFPWTIQFKQNFSRARNIQIANAAYGIDYEYPWNANIAGTYSGLEHIWAGCFNVCLRFKSANDTMYAFDVHVRDIWQIGNASVVDYMETHLTGWDVEYLDNLQGFGLEFYKTWQAMYFADSSAVYGTGTITHAAENLQLTNVLFGVVVQAIQLQSGTTAVSIEFANVIAQSETDTNRAASYLFNLASDNADVTFNGLRVAATGNAIMAVGGGTSGRVRINGLTVGSPLQAGMASPISGYDYFATGAAAFYLAHGSALSIPTGVQSVQAAAGAGPITSCVAKAAGAASNCGGVVATVAPNTPTTP